MESFVPLSQTTTFSALPPDFRQATELTNAMARKLVGS